MKGCEILAGWLCSFPAMSREMQASGRAAIDSGFRQMVRDAAPVIDATVAPLQYFLNRLEHAFTDTPWPIVFLGLLALVQWSGRSKRLTLGAAVALLLLGWLRLWEDTMVTLAMVAFATLAAIIIGLPLGVASGRSDRLRAVLTPILDVMQTLPSFVYLIPVVVVFGIGRVPGLIAVTFYAVPPLIRLTDLGLRSVPPELRQAAAGLGATPRQRLWRIDLPLALPGIMAGVNQTIMLALSMVVVASMVGVGGLGRNVLQAINNQFFTAGVLNGLALVALAMIFDRTARAVAKRIDPR